MAFLCCLARTLCNVCWQCAAYIEAQNRHCGAEWHFTSAVCPNDMMRGTHDTSVFGPIIDVFSECATLIAQHIAHSIQLPTSGRD